MSHYVGQYIIMRKSRRAAFLIVAAIFCAVLAQPSAADYVSAAGHTEVYLGGYPISIELYSDGPIVRTVTDNFAISGEIRVGDVIKEINGVPVSGRADINSLLLGENVTVPLTVKLLRNNSYAQVSLVPERDVCSDKLKLGFQTKDGISGLGTMTCTTKDKRFHALGHPISDSDSSSRFVCRSGSIFRCEISGLQRPSQGRAGRLIGKTPDFRNSLGTVEANTDFGLKGTLAADGEGQLCEIMPRSEVRPGKAQIMTTIRRNPQFYDIEIVKAGKQASPSEKGMVIRVTDETLLKNTGGILQGMSGSPILQNGKLVGAVTHVFTNDSTRGYGSYIEWILSA